MGLADIFAELQTTPVPDELELEAEKTARLFDDMEAKKLELAVLQKKLQEELRSRLAGLLAAYELAEQSFNEQCNKTMAAMEKKGIDEIPLKDRPPIFIKVVKGTKKSITKKWLCSASGLGAQAGEALWQRVPHHEDTTKLVVERRFDDQPSD